MSIDGAISRSRISALRHRASISASDRVLAAIGYAVVGLSAFSYILPGGTVLGGLLPLAGMILSILLLLLAPSRTRLRLWVTFPAGAALVLQFWSFLTELHAGSSLGREIKFGRADLYIIYALLPFFALMVLPQIDSRSPRRLANLFLAVFGLSCAVGILQFLRIPPFLALSRLYTYKPIDFWDGHSGVRAVGLTWHPNALAFQAIVGFGFLACRLVQGSRGRWDVCGVLFFSGAMFVTQDRLGYVALMVSWISLGIVMLRKDAKFGKNLLLGALSLCLAAGLVAAPRLGYALQSSDPSKDISLKFREDATWKQLDFIPDRVLSTGIGPSDGLMLGSGPEDRYVPVGRVMESGYRLVLAMYGWPGLVIFIVQLVGSVLWSGWLYLFKATTPGSRQWAACSFYAWLFVAINCNTANCIDGYMEYPFAFIAASIAAASAYSARRAAVAQVPSQGVLL